MARTRQPQLSYSETQSLMLNEPSRRAKARKIAAVVEHFRGIDDLRGLAVVDVGCSGGIVADELRRLGATVTGVDIDWPGLAQAQSRFGDNVSFVSADSEQLPLGGRTADVVICNHVYEHVVDPYRLVAELCRIVRPTGVLYLGLGNRLGVMEPHYRLPFLSWLPRRAADRYVRAFGRADHYHEAFMTRRGLQRLCRGLYVWDYTYTVMRDPKRFAATDAVPGAVARAPLSLLRLARPLIPTYLWIATPQPSEPKGPATSSPPVLVPTDARSA